MTAAGPPSHPLIVRAGASEQIAQAIRGRVERENLRAGDRLGSEGELAEQFGVSRPTLREAVRLLTAARLLRVVQGRNGGIYVAGGQFEGLGQNLSDSVGTLVATEDLSLVALLETRLIVEPPLAGLAARHATDETVAELVATLDAAAGHTATSEPFGAADTTFHATIARMAGNDLLLAFSQWFRDVLQPVLVQTTASSVDAAAILAQHARIAAAIEARDAPAAEQAMRDHIAYFVGLVAPG